MPIVSLDEVSTQYPKDEVLIQLGVVCKEEAAIQLQKAGFKDYISYTEARLRIEALNWKTRLGNDVIRADFYRRINAREKRLYLKFSDWIKNKESNMLLLCIPPRCGDHSLMKLLNELNIDCYNVWNQPRMFDVDNINALSGKNEPVKLITAVREPIIQNISVCFLALSSGAVYSPTCIFDEAWIEGGDVEQVFYRWLNEEKYICIDGQKEEISSETAFYAESGREKYLFPEMIQNFWKQFNDRMHLFDVPFDVNAGYQIMKVGNFDIFIYQIEKINSINKPLADWLGVKEKILIPREHAGDQKWYADIYEYAKNNIKLRKEYFDKCYSEEYVKHFYSEEMIKVFKESYIDRVF